MAPNHATLLSALLLLPIFLSLASSSSAAFLCSQKDTATLLKIKGFLSDSPSVASWNRSTDCCDWQSVGCNDDGTIVSLGIYGSKQAAPLPAAIGDLRTLIDIHITDTCLSGPIPPSFANLISLKSIVIRNSLLSGEIPSFLCDLPVLDMLDLTANRLTGSIPSCFNSKFASIGLGQNQLSGSIPASLFHGKPIFSTYLLDLHDNNLTGQIPTSFKYITFGDINLSGNRLAGDASFLFGTLKTIMYIDLSRNELGFDLSPVKFPRNLRALNISHNRITGNIPKQITKLSNLRVLDVSYNELCGPIPSGGSMNTLYHSAFDHNKCLCSAPLPPCNGIVGN